MRRRLFLRLVAACLLPALLALPCVLFAACATPPTTLAAAPTDDKNLADYLRTAFAEEQPCIPLADFGGLTEATLERVYAHLLATDPSLFFVTPTYTLSCRAEGDETVPVSLTPTYRYRGAALAAARADFAERVSAYLADLPGGAAPLARVADLHDRMILDFDYDESEEVVDPYTLLVGGRGVCQAYSLLFTVLCRAAGVAAEPVTCFERSHAWNQIEIDGDWYHGTRRRSPTPAGCRTPIFSSPTGNSRRAAVSTTRHGRAPYGTRRTPATDAASRGSGFGRRRGGWRPSTEKRSIMPLSAPSGRSIAAP